VEPFIKIFQIIDRGRRRLTTKSVSRIPIRLTIEGIGEAKGELIRFLAPRTVNALAGKLPIEGRAVLWRNEVYFEVPLGMGEEKAKNTAEKGRIAYWPMGRAFCVFYDRTRPHSSVNFIGKVTENLEIFSQVRSGSKIRVERT
jgi:hypothetical protein